MHPQIYTVMILYHQLMPQDELVPIRCIRCSRMLFKARGHVLWITNSAGIPLRSVDPGLGYTEHQCHSCKSLFKFLWQ